MARIRAACRRQESDSTGFASAACRTRGALRRMGDQNVMRSESWMLRGSFTWVRVTCPAVVAFRLVLGTLNCAELVALKASARNCRLYFSWMRKALNMETSAFGTLGGRSVGKRPLS